MSDTIDPPIVNLAAAQRVVAAAVAEVERGGLASCVAVSGAAGDLKAIFRMDGAPRLSAAVAMEKAYTVAAFGLPTHAWWDVIKMSRRFSMASKTARLIVFGGGVPLVVDGRQVGAVGGSGGSAEEDRRMAEAGAAAVSA